MLMWACDLIVAAEGTRFADVVGTRLGMCGVEYFAHPWEFGPRKTKELMLTGDALTVDEAYQLGMVSKVFPADELTEKTLEFARRIAEVPTMAAPLPNEAEQTITTWLYLAKNACFTLHQLNHSHWAQVHENGWPSACRKTACRTGGPHRPSCRRSRTRSGPTAEPDGRCFTSDNGEATLSLV